MPRFFGDRKPGPERHTAVLHRNAILRRRQTGGRVLPGAGFVFMKRPTRVFLVIALLVVIGGSLLRRARDPGELSLEAQIEMAQHNLDILRIAIERFHRDCGRYPTTREGLAALLLDPGAAGWRGPYILALKPDPWRRPFEYRYVNGQPSITSLGPDGIAGTSRDLHAAEPSPHHSSDQEVYRIAPAP